MTVPGEAFPKVGKKVYARMNGKYKVLIGLGNDEIGYIVPSDSGNPKGYKESMSLGRETEPLLLEALGRLLKGF